MPLLLTLFKFLGANKKLLIYAAAVLAVFLAGWNVNGARWERKYTAREIAWNAASQKATEQMESWRAQKQLEVAAVEQEAAERIIKIASENEALQRKITSSKAIHYEPTPTGSSEPRIAPVIRLCRNAAWSGSAADAAACQAGSVPGGGATPVPPAS